ncbi:hypothetical protein GLOIN_2v1728285 [Rhizophagus clarus]|uniref:Uncharacterized protein n=1 Tax=Rhizophagus clarus TaxID=94130 RepID=A0A8H3LVB3_9GLOM|nr:hypothetical protein GLOIN_2v1728285 [Rhizophagus clarus]
MSRGEGMSFASSDRKNDGKADSDRKKIGRKRGGFFRITTDRMEQLQVIGILNEGNRLQTITMDTPRGYISCVKHGKFFEISGRLSKLQPLGFVIKAMIVKTLDLINNDRLTMILTMMVVMASRTSQKSPLSLSSPHHALQRREIN